MKLLARGDAADRDAFDAVFAKVPERVRVDAADRLGLPPAALWLRLLQFLPPGAAEFWLLENTKGEVVGRVGATLTRAEPGAGYIGFFELGLGADVPASAKMLLGAAEDWLAERGVKQAIGPMVVNTWFPYRYRVGAVERRYAWEPVHPATYPELWRACGYSEYEAYRSDATRDLAAMRDRLAPSLRAVEAEGFTLRDFSADRLEDRDLPALYRLSMEVFKSAHLFEPLPYEVFRELYVPLVTKIDLSLSHFLVAPDGTEAGFLFSFLDRDPISDEIALVMKSIALADRFRGGGRSNALVCGAMQKALARGATLSISALIRVGNHSAAYTRETRFAFSHEYMLFMRCLAPIA